MKRGGWVAVALCGAIATVVGAAVWWPWRNSAHVVGVTVGAAVGFLEVIETFPTHAQSAFRSGWGYVLVAANALLALLFVSLGLAIYRPANPLLVAVVISLALPVVVRTKFTLLKASPSMGDDVVLDLGQAYDRIHRVCYQQADQELVKCWEHDIAAIVDRFPTSQAMLRLLSVRLDCLSRLSETERNRVKEDAARSAEQVADDATHLAMLARLVVESTGTIDTVSLDRLAALLRHGQDDRRLMALSADELRKRIGQCVVPPEVEQALARIPTDDTAQTRQMLAAYLCAMQDP